MSSKNVCQTSLMPTLHHKELFPYEYEAGAQQVCPQGSEEWLDEGPRQVPHQADSLADDPSEERHRDAVRHTTAALT
jgi:hypothetical protein